MKSYLSLSIKEIQKQKMTTLLIIIAIILSTAMTISIGQFIGTMNNMRINQARLLNGDRHVTFHELSDKQVNQLSKEGLSQIGVWKHISNYDIENTGISILIQEYDAQSIKNYSNNIKVKKGRLPKAHNEIVMDRNTLKMMGVKPEIGKKINLKLNVSLKEEIKEVAKTIDAEFTLSGILENFYMGYNSGLTLAVVGQGTVDRILPDKYDINRVDFKVNNLSKFQEKVDNLAQKIGLEESKIQYNWIYLDALGVDFRESERDGAAAGITSIAIFIGFLVLIAAGLVVYNIFKISIVKKIREYGALRAIGAEPNQLYKIIVIKVLILCAISIPIGVLIGILSSNTITTIIASMVNPDLFLADSPDQLTDLIKSNAETYILPLLVSVGLSLLFAFGAILPTAFYASKVSPKTAMSGKRTSAKRKVRKGKKIKNIERYLARINLKRHKGRTIVTMLSLFMSITVFVALNSFADEIDMGDAINNLKMGQFSLSSEAVGVNYGVIDELYENPNIERVSFIKYSIYGQEEIKNDIQFGNGSERLKVIGIDEKYLKEIYTEITEEQLEEFKSGNLTIIRNPANIANLEGSAELKVGDKITINEVDLTVASITNQTVNIQGTGWTNGVDIIVYDDIYDKITGKNTLNQVNIYVKNVENIEGVQKEIEKVSADNPGSRWLSYIEADKQIKETFESIKLFAWGFIALMTLIGALNIINTIYINILTRVNEIGMQRAIGMEKNSLYRMFLWEGAYYGIIASIFGSMAGYFISAFMKSTAMDSVNILKIPLMPIIGGSLLSVVICLLATFIPLRKIKNMSIVESIDIIE